MRQAKSFELTGRTRGDFTVEQRPCKAFDAQPRQRPMASVPWRNKFTGNRKGRYSLKPNYRIRAISLGIVVLLGILPSLAHAAGFELLSISSQSIAESNLVDPEKGTIEEDLTFQVIYREARLVVPIPFNDGKTVFINSLSANQVEMQIGGLPSPQADIFVQNFYGQSYSLTFVQQLSGGYSLTVLTSVGRFADRNPPTS